MQMVENSADLAENEDAKPFLSKRKALPRNNRSKFDNHAMEWNKKFGHVGIKKVFEASKIFSVVPNSVWEQ